ncbi:MAG: flagellar motor switch protein FliM [Planctomycetota bacterium]
MSDESLSQNQVENLLKAMEASTDDAAADGDDAAVDDDDQSSSEDVSPSQAAEAEGSASEPKTSAPIASRFKPDPSGKPYSPGVPAGARVTAYDFKRPERVGKEQMRAMHSLHEQIARNFGASISGMLRTMIEVKLLSVDQLTYSEFVFSLDNPSCFNVLTVEPLEGNWILDIAPALTYSVIDRMLGGDPVPGETIRRPLTEIETRLICRVVEQFLAQIGPAWENVVEIKPKIEATESNPQLVQIVPPNEVVILVGFEVLLGKNRGMMNLCIPFNTIEKHNAKLSRNGWVGYGKSEPNEQSRRTIADAVDAAPVDVVVTLARSRIRTSDLLDLGVGDIITTEQEVAKPLELSIQDVPKFTASPGAYRGKKAVQVQHAVEPKQSSADLPPTSLDQATAQETKPPQQSSPPSDAHQDAAETSPSASA